MERDKQKLKVKKKNSRIHRLLPLTDDPCNQAQRR